MIDNQQYHRRLRARHMPESQVKSKDESWLVWLRRAAGRSVGWVPRVPVWSQIAAATVLVGFSVVRNLPAVPGLRG